MFEKMKMIWQDAKQLKDERGLTLVELLVVVVILGIIAAIAVVAIGGIIENSKKDAMVADAKQMVSAAKLYTASNPVTADTTLDFLSADKRTANATSGVTEAVGAKSYITSMKDPFASNNTNYTVADIVIQPQTDGTYRYAINLTGTKFKLANTQSDALAKSSLATP